MRKPKTGLPTGDMISVSVLPLARPPSGAGICLTVRILEARMRLVRFLITATVVLSELLLIVPGSHGDSPKSSVAASLKLATTNIDFNRDIRPILSKNCFVCHGADEGNRKVKLRLDVREEATKIRKKGKAAI